MYAPSFATFVHKRVKPLLLVFSFMVFSPLVFSQSDDWSTFNQSITDDWVIPAYEDFAVSGNALAETSKAFCAQPEEDSFDELQSAFHSAMDDWQSVQHIKFGPITYFNWQFRLHFWPDDNGTGGRQLTALIDGGDATLLETESFARQSIGVQGFPALERLLFEGDSFELIQQDMFRCDLLSAISQNIGEISQDVLQRWQDEFRASVMLDDDSEYFEDAEDASVDFVKALVEAIPVISEKKLMMPVGESFDRFRERRAESWRSARSLRNIKINVAAISSYFYGEGYALSLQSLFPPDNSLAIAAAFSRVETHLSSLSDGMLEQAEDEAGYVMLVELRALLDELYEALEQGVKETDLYLGFNSLDGD